MECVRGHRAQSQKQQINEHPVVGAPTRGVVKSVNMAPTASPVLISIQTTITGREIRRLTIGIGGQMGN